MKTVSIGPETSEALRALGTQPTLEARKHTVEGLVEALLSARER
jgi:uroporphyrinogen-III synthase